MKGITDMLASQSLMIGHSFLPVPYLGVDALIDAAATAAQKNPDVATEITLAATDAVLAQYGSQGNLGTTLKQMVERLCQARDQTLTR